MNLSKSLTEKHLKDILINTYKLVEETTDIHVRDLINEIEKQIYIALKSLN